MELWYRDGDTKWFKLNFLLVLVQRTQSAASQSLFVRDYFHSAKQRPHEWERRIVHCAGMWTKKQLEHIAAPTHYAGTHWTHDACGRDWNVSIQRD